VVASPRDGLQAPQRDHSDTGHRHWAQDPSYGMAPPVVREGRWRKLKGKALVELPGGEVVWAEIHWYEAHGLGRVDMKVKRLLE
jgi:hypothetical protein